MIKKQNVKYLIQSLIIKGVIKITIKELDNIEREIKVLWSKLQITIERYCDMDIKKQMHLAISEIICNSLRLINKERMKINNEQCSN